MIKIGITGSMSSGKSTVAKIISRRVYPLFSADAEVKKFYNNKKFVNKISKKLNIRSTNLLKNKIKIILKKDKSKIKIIESLIHPEVRRQMKRFMKKKAKIVVFEIPLLIESNLMKYFDKIIFVNAHKTLRLKRYIKRGGDKEMFHILNKRQLSFKKKAKFCDVVLNNNKSLRVLKKNIKNIIKNYD
tara:strand:+ start:1186 stop:1746 length:561 start_codon:yes stop_codon:yes gene_type:complete